MSETERKDKYIKKANEFLEKADKEKDDEKAAKLCRKAATFFKMAGEWKKAGDAYHYCAELYYKEGEVRDSTDAFSDAGECYLKDKDSVKDGKDSFTQSIQLCQDMLNFTMASFFAGKYGRNLEKILDYEGALIAYQWGRDINDMEDMPIVKDKFADRIDRIKNKLSA